MATNTLFSEEDITLTSGKETDEYKKVRANLSRISTILHLKTDAKNTLRLKFIEKEWLSTTDNPSSDDLMLVVLGRIEHDSNQYYAFIAMLEDTPGLDLIKKEIKETTFSQQESHSDHAIVDKNEVKEHNLRRCRNNPSVNSKRTFEGNGTTSRLPKNTKTMLGHESSQIQYNFASSSTEEPNVGTMDLEASTTQPSGTQTDSQGALVTGAHNQDNSQVKKIELDSLRRQVSYLEAQVAALIDEMRKKDEQLKAFEKEITLYQQKNAEKESLIESMKMKEVELKKKCDAALHDKNKMEERYKDMRAQIKKHESKIESLELQMKKYETQHLEQKAISDKERAEDRSRIEKLEQKHKSEQSELINYQRKEIESLKEQLRVTL